MSRKYEFPASSLRMWFRNDYFPRLAVTDLALLYFFVAPKLGVTEGRNPCHKNTRGKTSWHWHPAAPHTTTLACYSYLQYYSRPTSTERQRGVNNYLSRSQSWPVTWLTTLLTSPWWLSPSWDCLHWRSRSHHPRQPLPRQHSPDLRTLRSSLLLYQSEQIGQ